MAPKSKKAGGAAAAGWGSPAVPDTAGATGPLFAVGSPFDSQAAGAAAKKSKSKKDKTAAASAGAERKEPTTNEAAADGEGFSTLLGVISTQLTTDVASDPCVSRVGGVPAWLTAAQTIPPCGCCGAQRVFVSQVYAPATDEEHRVLYLFGCNKAACSVDQRGWFVCRQSKAKPAAAVVPPVTTPAPATPTVTTARQSVPTAWDAPSWDTPAGGGGGWDAAPAASAWAAPAWDTPVAESAVKAEAVPAPSAGTVKASKHKPKGEAVKGDFIGWVLRVEEGYEVAGDDDDEGPAEFTASERALYDRYLAEQAEAAAAAAATATAGVASDDGSGAPVDEEEETETEERVPDHVKQLLRFQEHVAANPKQCLRYAYGGKPMWPGKPPKTKVVACACGQGRQFELQLLPTTMFHIDVDAHARVRAAESKSSEEKATAPLSALIDTMDWSTIAVYSCPASCERSGVEEVIVAPPVS